MNENILLEVLVSLTTISSFIGVCVGLSLYKKIDRVRKYIFFYLVAAFIIDLLSRYLHIAFNNTLILIPVFGFIELLIFSMIYRSLLFKNNRLFKPIIGIILVIILVDILTCNAFNPKQFQSYGRTIDGFVIIILCLTFYWKILKGSLQNTKEIGLNTGILLFFLLNSLWFLITNFLVSINYKVMFPVWLINIITIPIFYSFLTFHLWKNGKSQKL